MVDGREPLSSDDARILALESTALTGHTMKLIVLAPGAPLDLGALRADVSNRLASQPRALQRVETGEDGVPRWTPAENFDIADHVRRRTGGHGLDREGLRHLVGELMTEHLDRSHPLWIVDLLGPLADGSEVIAVRMHHAMVDGIAGMRFLDTILLDPRDTPVHDAGTHAAEAAPSGLKELRRLPSALVRELGRPGSASPFDKNVTGARELSFITMPLSGLKVVGASRADRATVNDVLLAVVAGGLRSWLPRQGHRDLRVQVPVSLHHRGEQPTDLGNRDSFINVDLFLNEPDPLRRLDLISARTRTEKKLADAAVLDDFFHELSRIGPADNLVNRIAGSSREFSVAVSNVPGPRTPVAVSGRTVNGLYSFAEPAEHHVVRISAISHSDELGVGFCTDPSAVPDIDSLADAVGVAYRHLRDAAPHHWP